MRLKVWTLLLALCANFPLTHAQEFNGKIIFSVEILESSERQSTGSKGPKKRTGNFYYYKEGGPGEYGPTITGYKLRAGKILDVAGAGSLGDEELLRKLNALSMTSFDVQKEIDITRANLHAEARRNATGVPRIMTADGAKLRIRYDFNGVSIDHTALNPGPAIHFYAPYSEKLGKLDELIGLFAAYYGRWQFQL